MSADSECGPGDPPAPRPDPNPPSAHYVYLLRCRDGSYYCGYSTDPVRRTAVHNSGKGAKYTRSRLPVELVYVEAHPTKQAALSREWHLKRLSHSEKEALRQGSRNSDWRSDDGVE